MSIVIGVFVALLVLLTFFGAGSSICAMLNLKLGNPFATIVVGFFGFFAFLTIFLIPMQWIPNITFKSELYVVLAYFIIYFIFAMATCKYWFNSSVISMKTVMFFIAVGVIMLLTFVGQTFITKSSIDDTTRTVKTFMTFVNEWTQTFIANLTNSFGRAASSTFFMMLDLIAVIFNTPDVIISYVYMINGLVVASLFMIMFSLFSSQKTQGGKWGAFVATLFTFGVVKVLTFYFNFSIATGDEYFMLLIIFVCLLVVGYSASPFRQQNIPFLIGFVLGSYMGFSKEDTYPMIFLLYAFVFVIQLWGKVGYVRDIIRMSALVFLEFALFNIAQKLWVQTAVFGGFILIAALLQLRTQNNYYFQAKFELYVQQRNIFAILLLPVAFAVVSAGISLANNQPFLSQDTDYLVLLFKWIENIESGVARKWLIYIISLVVLGVAVLWVFIRQRVKKSYVISAIDLLLLSYLTFYNPITVKTINIIYPEMMQTGGNILIGIAFVMLTAIPFEVANQISTKTARSAKLVVNLKPSRIKI